MAVFNWDSGQHTLCFSNFQDITLDAEWGTDCRRAGEEAGRGKRLSLAEDQ